MAPRAVLRRAELTVPAIGVLVWVVARFLRIPSHVGDLGVGPEIRIGITVAIKTPRHAQWLLLMNLNHLVNPTMAAHATHAGRKVNAVIEKRVVGQHVNANPLHCLTGLETLPDWLERLAIGLYILVTVHARLCRRDSRPRTTLYRVVAITTVNTKFSDVERMTVGNRLFGHIAHVCKFR